VKYRVFRLCVPQDGVEGITPAGVVHEWDEIAPFETSSGYVDPRELGLVVGQAGRYLLVPPLGDYGVSREIALVEDIRLVEAPDPLEPDAESVLAADPDEVA